MTVCLSSGPALAGSAELNQVQSVYLLPMGSGFDQYLASQMIRNNVYQVVADPKRADAVLTDQIGMGFERRLTELYPPPPEQVEKPVDKADKKDGDKSEKEKPAKKADRREDNQPPISAFQRGKGNIYLVDLKTRRVIWSNYDRPRNYSADELNKTSGRVIEKLKKDIGQK